MSQQSELLMRVAEAAAAEVRAQGYRSSEMARALEALYGPFWFEGTMIGCEELPRCGYRVTTEMDDGPLDRVCVLSEGHAANHRFAPGYTGR